MEFTEKSGSAAYLSLLRHVHDHGDVISPRGRKTWEVRHVTVRITDPTAVHVLDTTRRPNLRIAATEAIQLLAGVSNLDQLNDASGGRFSEYANDGLLLGAYGPRTWAQLSEAVALLRRDPASRQAVVTIWNGRERATVSGDVPCTTTLQFFLRDGKLELRVTMRSNDLFLGVPYDWMMFSFIQRAVAQSLDVPTGDYVHAVGSLHLYESHEESARQISERGISGRHVDHVASHGLPLPTALPSLSQFAALRRGADQVVLRRPTDPWVWNNSVMTWWRDHVPPMNQDSYLCLTCRYVVKLASHHACPVALTTAPRLTSVVNDVTREYLRALAKHGPYSLDGNEIDDKQRLAALVEEVGEVARHLTYDHDGPDAETELYWELIQTANVALTWATVVHRGPDSITEETTDDLAADDSVLGPVDPPDDGVADVADQPPA